MDFRLSDEEEKRRREFFGVCQKLEKEKPEDYVGKEAAYETKHQAYVKRCRQEFAKRGWLRIGWPAEYGGMGTMMDSVFFAEATGYHDVPGVDVFGVKMLAPTLIGVANKETKDRFLPPIGNGEVLWCELWSEPDAGSDLASLTATAIRKGNEYVINGQKTWTTNAHNADWGFGVFKTDIQARKHHNLSFLLADMRTPGVAINPLYYMDGGHYYNEVFFDDVHIPVENIVGEEGKGWQVSQTLAGFERSGAGAIMTMRRMLEDLVKYCNETEVGGKLLAKNPVIRNRLAETACEIEAGRALSYRIADLQNRGEMALFDASAVKVLSGELQERISALGTDILGTYGQVKPSKWAPLRGLWEKQYQECFVLSIAMGTNEIQKNIIAWYGLGLPRPPRPPIK